jgi:hypothetical protein
MSALANRISELAGLLGTVEGLGQVNDEIRTLNERLAQHDLELSRDEVLDLHAALAFLGTAISGMNRVARGMLERAGVRGIDYVG